MSNELRQCLFENTFNLFHWINEKRHEHVQYREKSNCFMLVRLKNVRYGLASTLISIAFNSRE